MLLFCAILRRLLIFDSRWCRMPRFLNARHQGYIQAYTPSGLLDEVHAGDLIIINPMPPRIPDFPCLQALKCGLKSE
jgi:hypothetical protein